jgi:hypothetical protein
VVYAVEQDRVIAAGGANRYAIHAGFRSAFREANGAEPGVTWPTGLIREVPEDDPPRCLDYVWLRGAITAPACRQVFDRPDADDPTLYPTDHVGLAASLEVGG